MRVLLEHTHYVHNMIHITCNILIARNFHGLEGQITLVYFENIGKKNVKIVRRVWGYKES